MANTLLANRPRRTFDLKADTDWEYRHVRKWDSASDKSPNGTADGR
jgi:hypothetical protein